jgi:hypothetical protein
MVRNGYATAAEARRALDRPLRLAAGPALVPLRGVSIAPGPAFYWAELALGLIVLVVGLGGLVGLRAAGPRLAARPGAIAAKAGVALAIIVGALLVLGSFRGV